MEPNSCLGPPQRARVAIRKEINIKTDDNAKRTKSNHRALASQSNTDVLKMAMVNEQKHIMPRRDYLSKEQVKNNGVIHICM
jgi:hypothetical protein